MSALLEVTGISVRFGGVEALRSVSMTVPSGRVVGLMGPNGAGKTTLLQVISGLRAPDEGAVSLRGRDITRLRPSDRAALGIGRSFQHPGVTVEETVEDNVLAGRHLGAGYGALDPLFRPWRHRRGERTLHAELERTLSDFGLSGRRSDLVGELSFEGTRFVELAAVLSTSPDLLLLDEPTAGLDPAGRERLTTLLRREHRPDASILLVTHDLSFLSCLCDHVYVLVDGRVLAEGPPQVLAQDETVVDAYLGRGR